MGFKLKSIDDYVMLVVGFVVLFKIIAVGIPLLTGAGDEINATGISLASFFASDGILWIILLAGVLIYAIKAFMGKSK